MVQTPEPAIGQVSQVETDKFGQYVFVSCVCQPHIIHYLLCGVVNFNYNHKRPFNKNSLTYNGLYLLIFSPLNCKRVRKNNKIFSLHL